MNPVNKRPERRLKPPREQVFAFVAFLLFWFLLTPRLELPALAIGVVVSAAVVHFCHDILFSRRELPLYHPRTWPVYVALMLRLAVEIVKANIDVALAVLNPRLPIQPQFVKIPLDIKNEFNRTIYANCVTLTPGTLAIDIQDDYMVVHALGDHAAAGLANNFIAPKLTSVEEVSES